jgi:hypothetical protein
MTFLDDILADVQCQIAAGDDALREARNRTNLVLDIALGFPGARRTFRSGSLAVHTFNDPVTDGDGGVVLDRRIYPTLGPDGQDVIPNDVVADMCALLGPAVRKEYPKAVCRTSKRGPKMLFGQPINGQDPTVDLVVAMERRDANGLWIPHLVKKRWDKSDPEEHVRLLNADPESLRRLRRRVIRLLKAWNKQWGDPAFSSFHLSVFAWMWVESGMSVGIALKTVFEKAAKHIASGVNTTDPAGVSLPIRLLLDRATAVSRLSATAAQMSKAVDHATDEKAARQALSRVFRNYVEAPAQDKLASTIGVLRGAPAAAPALLGLRPTAPPVSTARRAFGGPAPR